MEPTTTTEASEEPGEGGGRGTRPLPQPIIAAIVALVIGLAGGFVIGWKVEQSRVKDDVKELKARLTASEPNEERKEDEPKARRPQGEVTAVSADSVTIKDADGERSSSCRVPPRSRRRSRAPQPTSPRVQTS